jgi:TonB family protein
MKKMIRLVPLLFFMITTSLGQKVTITGLVKEKGSHSPLFGVEVYINNTNEGTISDFNGNFKLETKLGDEIVFQRNDLEKASIIVENDETVVIELEQKRTRRERKSGESEYQKRPEKRKNTHFRHSKTKEKKKKKGYIYGKVVGGDNNWELPFVLIEDVKTNNVTVTDLEGKFEIKADSGSFLRLKAKGYHDKYFPVLTRDSLSIMLTKSAEFPGGEEKMYEFIRQNINYPEDALKMRLEGIVHVKLKVEKDGSLTNIRVVKSVFKSLDEEAIRIVKLFPKWKPALYNSEPVGATLTIPIVFNIPVD